MEKSLINRLQATVLAVATAGLIVLAVMNLRQDSQFQQPDDGVWWREVQGGLEATKVLPDSPAQRAGIQQGDLLTGAEVLPDTPPQRSEIQAQEPAQDQTQDHPQDLLGGGKTRAPAPSRQAEISAQELLPKTSITRLADLDHVLYRTGIYGKASYAITRSGTPLDTPVVVIPEPLDRGLAQAQRAIGLVYLAIGIYVLFRRWGAARATHFYLF